MSESPSASLMGNWFRRTSVPGSVKKTSSPAKEPIPAYPLVVPLTKGSSSPSMPLSPSSYSSSSSSSSSAFSSASSSSSSSSAAKQVPSLATVALDEIDLSLPLASPAPGAPRESGSASPSSRPHHTRLDRLNDILARPVVDLVKLREMAWNGLCPSLRPSSWKLLLGYLPCNVERRQATLARKRGEYQLLIKQHFESVWQKWIENQHNSTPKDDEEEKIFRQIVIDVPRTGVDCALFQQPCIQRSLERILYLWAIRHPASGYVQGINDLATPFLVVYLGEYLQDKEKDVLAMDVEKDITADELAEVEADVFWSLSKLLDPIQENYTFPQAGIQKMVFRLQELVATIDGRLAEHLEQENVLFIQFAFRWMNCLLMRELPLKILIRLWDTYLAEGDDFPHFHVYVCAAFLTHWSSSIIHLEFQQIMMALQRPRTQAWTDSDIELIISQAYVYKSLYSQAPNHFR